MSRKSPEQQGRYQVTFSLSEESFDVLRANAFLENTSVIGAVRPIIEAYLAKASYGS